MASTTIWVGSLVDSLVGMLQSILQLAIDKLYPTLLGGAIVIAVVGVIWAIIHFVIKPRFGRTH